MSTAIRRSTPARSTRAATGRRGRTQLPEGAGGLPLSGNQRARIELIPEGEENPCWLEIVDFVAALGVELDPWQWRILWASLLVRDGDYAATRVGVCAPRQNGKNAILEMRELVGCCVLGEKMVIHSAHLADTSMEGFHRLEGLIDANDWLTEKIKHIRRQNGHEQITFKNGSRIRFRTRTGGGGRGFSAPIVIFDEAMYLSELSHAAMKFVTSAKTGRQVWMTGSAVDQQTMDDGRVFAKLRESALEGDPEVAYFEWSLDYPTPAEVPFEEMLREDVQEATNPAFAKRILAKTIAEELRSFPDPRTAAVERFGVGDWPKTGQASSVIDLDLWEGLVDRESKPLTPVVYAFDVRPDRSYSTVVAVGRRPDGNIHLEVGEHERGTGWLVATLEELERKRLPIGIVCDGVGPAASIVPELLQRNVMVRALTTPEVGEACGMFFDAVHDRKVRHLGQPELLHAIKGAVQRPLGDRWAWSRRNSTSDISPLVAVTLGTWAIITEEQKAPLFGFG